MAIAIAPVIVTEIRAQADGPTRQTEATTRLKLVTAHAGEEVVVEETDDRLLVDASAGDLRVKLPQPSRVDHRMLTFERIDRTDRDVVLEPLGRLARTGGRRAAPRRRGRRLGTTLETPPPDLSKRGAPPGSSRCIPCIWATARRPPRRPLAIAFAWCAETAPAP